MVNISERGVIISFSCLLFEIAFSSVLKARYTAMTQTTTKTKIGLLKRVIIPARSRTEIDPKAHFDFKYFITKLILIEKILEVIQFLNPSDTF